MMDIREEYDEEREKNWKGEKITQPKACIARWI